MKQNEQQYKIAVETQWNIYSNPYCDYHKVYSAYTKANIILSCLT